MVIGIHCYTLTAGLGLVLEVGVCMTFGAGDGV